MTDNEFDEFYEPDMSPDEGRLMFRYDLEEAVGVIAYPPTYRVDALGRLVRVKPKNGQRSSADLFREFRTEIEAIVEEVAQELAPETPLERALPSHPYQQPPAAQGITEVAFMLWEHKEAIADNILRLVGVGKIVTETTKRTIEWLNDKQQQEEMVLDRPGDTVPTIVAILETDPVITWTQGAAATAVLSDAYHRYGLSDETKVHVYPRGNAYSGGPTHPDQYITYLVRVQDGPRVLIYDVTAGGRVREHYQLAGDRITPLPLPDLIGEHTGVTLAPFPGLTLPIERTNDSTPLPQH